MDSEQFGTYAGVFLERSAILVEQAKKLSQSELARLMKLSDKLTDLNYHRFRAFSPPFTLSNAKQAVLAFRGDTYVGLKAENFTKDDITFAQNNLLIIFHLHTSD